MRIFRKRVEQLPEPRSIGTLYRRRERLPWRADRNFRILSIDGGGIRGILPLAFLARLEQTFLQGRSIANYFDLITGTSTGGIIALGLGKGLTATDILEIYIKRGGEVFPPLNWFQRNCQSASKYIINRCDRDKLDTLIDEVVGRSCLWQSKVRLCIPAAETNHFEPFIFKTPHHPDYKKDWVKEMALVAKTTSAAPTFFSPVKGNDGYEFLDGGIWANNPIMVGVADALACFDVKRENIKILSLGCVKDKYTMPWLRRILGGEIFWTNLVFECMHLQSQNVVGQARLIVGGDSVLRVDAEPIFPKIELSDWKRSCAMLPEVGDSLFDRFSEAAEKMFLRELSIDYEPLYMP